MVASLVTLLNATKLEMFGIRFKIYVLIYFKYGILIVTICYNCFTADTMAHGTHFIQFLNLKELLVCGKDGYQIANVQR